MPSLREYALHYASSLNFSIFPLGPRSKLPITQHGFLDATADLRVIDDWWRRFPEANIGCATGMTSALAVLDFDQKPDANEILAAFQKVHGTLPPTATAKSGSGGCHFFYKLRSPLRSKNGLQQGLDLKADGGYIVLPPSIHPIGSRYEWVSTGTPEKPFTDFPDFVARLRDQSLPSENNRSSSRSFQNIGSIVTDGFRTDTLVSLIGHLLGKDVHPLVVKELVLALNETKFKPPLPAEKVLNTLESIAGRELRKRPSRYA